MRIVADATDLFGLAPRQDLLNQVSSNEAYCAANPGSAYVIYFPKDEEVTLTLDGATYQVRWLNTERAEWTRELTVNDRTVILCPQMGRNSVAVVTAVGDDNR